MSVFLSICARDVSRVGGGVVTNARCHSGRPALRADDPGQGTAAPGSARLSSLAGLPVRDLDTRRYDRWRVLHRVRIDPAGSGCAAGTVMPAVPARKPHSRGGLPHHGPPGKFQTFDGYAGPPIAPCPVPEVMGIHLNIKLFWFTLPRLLNRCFCRAPVSSPERSASG
jgi:hypothetical protein